MPKGEYLEEHIYVRLTNYLHFQRHSEVIKNYTGKRRESITETEKKQ